MIFVFRLSIANFLLNQNRVAAFFYLQQLCRNLSFVSKSVWRLDYRRRHDTTRKSRMVTPPSLQIYLQFCVTLTFNLLTTKLTISCPCHIDHLCQLASTSVHLFSKYPVHKLGETNGWTNERTT